VNHQPRQPEAPASSTPPVIPADPADLDILSQVIAGAFHHLPPSRWLIPDPAARRNVFPAYFRTYIEHALASGTAHTTPGRTAVALWIPIGAEPPSPPADYEARLTAATTPWTQRFLAFDQALDRHHPAGLPHHHLAILAVQPGLQGRGTGSALLRAHHHQLDQTGTAAYLEASSLHTAGLYQRHGYILLPSAPYYLPDNGPPMWPMWREPQQKLPKRIPRPGGP
jgi:ribosomal protein S18 acetylase RimI-like enzyme